MLISIMVSSIGLKDYQRSPTAFTSKENIKDCYKSTSIIEIRSYIVNICVKVPNYKEYQICLDLHYEK